MVRQTGRREKREKGDVNRKQKKEYKKRETVKSEKKNGEVHRQKAKRVEEKEEKGEKCIAGKPEGALQSEENCSNEEQLLWKVVDSRHPPRERGDAPPSINFPLLCNEQDCRNEYYHTKKIL